MFNPRYKLLGVEEFPYICDFCKRKEIINCYIVEDLETLDVLRFGSVCIQTALGIQARDIKKEIDSRVKEIRNTYRHLLFEIKEKQTHLSAEWRASMHKTVGMCPMDYKNYQELYDQERDLKKKMDDELKPFGHSGFYQ